LYQNIEEDTGQTPVHICCQYGNLGMLVHLLSLRVKLIGKHWKARWGGTPLHVCASDDRPQIAKLILRQMSLSTRQKCLKITNFDKRTPYDCAFHSGHTNMVEIMSSEGFRKGDIVLISGLTSETGKEYNGKKGTLVTNFSKERFGVRFDDESNVRIRPRNLSLATPEVLNSTEYPEDVTDGRFWENSKKFHHDVETEVLVGRLKAINYPVTGKETREELQKILKDSGYKEHKQNNKVKKAMKKNNKKKRREAQLKAEETFKNTAWGSPISPINDPDGTMAEAFGRTNEVKAELLRVRDACVRIAYQTGSRTEGSLTKKSIKKALATAKTNHYFRLATDNRKIRRDWLKKCVQCGTRNGKLKACQRCRYSFYCSGKCQKAHWKVHKLLCPTLKRIHFDEWTLDMHGFIRGNAPFIVNPWIESMWTIESWDQFYSRARNYSLPSSGTILHFSGNKEFSTDKDPLGLDEMESMSTFLGTFEGKGKTKQYHDDNLASERREDTDHRSYSHTIGGAIVALQLRNIDNGSSSNDEAAPFIIDVVGASNWVPADVEVTQIDVFAVCVGMMFPQHCPLYFRYIGPALTKVAKKEVTESLPKRSDMPKRKIWTSIDRGIYDFKEAKNVTSAQLVIMYHPGPNTNPTIHEECMNIMMKTLLKGIPLCVTEFCEVDLMKVVVLLKQYVIPCCQKQQPNRSFHWLKCGPNPWGTLKKKLTFSYDGIDATNQHWLIVDPREKPASVPTDEEIFSEAFAQVHSLDTSGR